MLYPFNLYYEKANYTSQYQAGNPQRLKEGEDSCSTTQTNILGSGLHILCLLAESFLAGCRPTGVPSLLLPV
jgi:hypothetical protein